jgi:hypothetical protein
MSLNAGVVPFSYGDLVSITNDGAKTLLWFLARDGILRGVPLEVHGNEPKLDFDREVVIKRGGVTDSSARQILSGAKPKA